MTSATSSLVARQSLDGLRHAWIDEVPAVRASSETHRATDDVTLAHEGGDHRDVDCLSCRLTAADGPGRARSICHGPPKAKAHNTEESMTEPIAFRLYRVPPVRASPAASGGRSLPETPSRAPKMSAAGSRGRRRFSRRQRKHSKRLRSSGSSLSASRALIRSVPQPDVKRQSLAVAVKIAWQFPGEPALDAPNAAITLDDLD